MVRSPAIVLIAALVGMLSSLSSCRPTILATGARPAAERSEDGRAPAAAFFRKPLLSHVRISPDGRHVSGVHSRAGREILMIRETRGGELVPLAALDRDDAGASATLRRVGWASDDHLLLSVESPYRESGALRVQARQSRLILVPTDGGRMRYLGKRWENQEYFQYQDDIIHWLPDDPEHVLVSLRKPTEKGAGARRLHIRSGRMRTVAAPRTGVFRWAADHLGRVRAGWGEPRRDSERFLYARTSGEGSFEEILRWNPWEETGFDFAGFSEREEQIYVWKRDERGRRALYRYDLAEQRLEGVVYQHPEVDVGRLLHSRVDGKLLAAEVVTDRPRLQFLDEDARLLHASIDEALPNRTNRLISANRDETRFIVRSSSDIVPPQYYVFDREERSLSLLLSAYPELEGSTFSPMQAIEYEARDGLVIPGYLTVPADAGDAPLPTIVIPHGGPWARDVWGWDPVVQFLASRGFAVLQPNFRGSSGYGQAFESKGYGAWGLAMQDDITDGVAWLVERGIADPDRVGIFGVSYGGFAALYALVKEPGTFRAGASFAGVADPLTLLDDDQEYWGLIDDMEQLVGHRRRDRDALEAISPVRNAHRIRAPVLLAHGTKDPRVHVRHAHKLASALERNEADVEVLLYEGEVHGFLDERNEIDFYTRLAAFFERHLAPRPAGPPASEPLDDAGRAQAPTPARF
ncbi:MAG: S9 family peptidase [Myxococcota bacterium]